MSIVDVDMFIWLHYGGSFYIKFYSIYLNNMIQLKNINKLYVFESFNKVVGLTEEECTELSVYIDAISEQNQNLIDELDIFSKNCQYYATKCSELEKENKILKQALKDIRESSKKWVSFLRVPSEYHENKVPEEVVEKFRNAMMRYKMTIDIAYDKENA